MMRNRLYQVASSSPSQGVVRLILLVLGALALASDGAYAREPISPEALAQLTGVDRAFDNLAGSLAEQGNAIASQGQVIGDKDTFVATWRNAAQAAFAPDKLKAAYAKRLTGKLAPNESIAVEDFFRSKLGRRMVAAEASANTSEAQQAMIAQAKELMERLAKDSKRKAALNRVSRSIKLEEMTIKAAMNMSRAVLIGLSSAGASGQRMTLEEIMEAIEKQRPQIAAEISAVMALTLAYVYRELPVADVNAYANFLETPAGAKYADQSIKGLDATLSEAGLAFGRALAQGLNKDPI